MTLFAVMGIVTAWFFIGVISTALFVYLTSRADGTALWEKDPTVYLFVVFGPITLIVAIGHMLVSLLAYATSNTTIFDHFSWLGAKHGREE